jgi:3'(2'), 5'-bisphosphate nucleotidase
VTVSATLSRPLVDRVVGVAYEAGQRILRVSHVSAHVDRKSGGDPVTNADRAAHDAILSGLLTIEPRLPILSEEGDIPEYAIRSSWHRFWLVDPLDGTKEFVSGSGEFTVNIALVEQHRPVLGVVYAPALDLLYFAEESIGAWKKARGGQAERIYSSEWPPDRPARVVESRSHPSRELEAFLSSIPVAERLAAGSSLKFCFVAEGRADLYPRFGPVMEWDAAAGDCIYRYSGRAGERPSSIRYNQPDLRISSFVIGSDRLARWPATRENVK